MSFLLFRTALANLRSRPLQSTLLAIVIGGAAASLALAFSLHKNASDPFDQIMRATNGADVHVMAFSGRDDLTPVTRLPGIRAVSRPEHFADVRVTGGPAQARLSLLARPVPEGLDKPRLTDGRWVGITPGEVVLERTFARARHLTVGDRIAVVGGPRHRQLTVVGIAVSAEAGPFPDFEPASSWVGERTLSSIAPDERRLGRQLHIQLTDREASTAFVARVARMYPPERVGVYDWREVEDSVTESTDGLSVILGSASLLALIAAGLVIANAISGRVLAARRDIGLLKAAGFTPGGVTALFVTENLVLALGAGLVGTALGIALSPLLLERSARLLGTPTPSGLSADVVAIGVLGVAALVTVFTAIPAWRAGRLKPLEAIRLGRSSVSAKPSRMAALATRLHLPAPVALGFKDSFSARSRAIMTILSLAVTMFAVVATLGTEATYNRVVKDSSLRAKPYDVLVSTDLPAARARALLARHASEVDGTSTLVGFPVTAPGRSEPIEANALGGEYQRRPYAIRQGRMLAGPGEAIVGRGLLDQLHLRVGDRLRLRAMGAPLDLRIVGRYIEPDNDAVTVRFDERSLAAAQRARLRPDYGLTVSGTPEARRLTAALERESGGAMRVTVTEDEVKQERADLRPVVWGMDILLLSIGLVSLLTTLLIGIRERRRDFAIFKTVGLTPRQILAAVTASGLLPALLAIVIGVPFGAILFHLVVVATNPTDGPDLVTTPTWWSLLLLLPATLVFTTLASLLPGRRAAEIKPAEALRYE